MSSDDVIFGRLVGWQKGSNATVKGSSVNSLIDKASAKCASLAYIDVGATVKNWHNIANRQKLQ